MVLDSQLWDFALKVSAPVIALCALFLTMYQASLQRKHHQLSVKPHITTFAYTDVKDKIGTIRIDLMNNGLGPAFIDKFTYYEGEEVCIDVEGAIKERISNTISCNVSELGTDYALRANQEIELFSASFPCENPDHMNEVEAKLEQINLIINYHCAYEKEFVFNSWKSRLNR